MKPRLELLRSSEPMAVRKSHPRSVVIKRADFDAYEREMQRRESMRVIAFLCVSVVVGAGLLALILHIAGR